MIRPNFNGYLKGRKTRVVALNVKKAERDVYLSKGFMPFITHKVTHLIFHKYDMNNNTGIRSPKSKLTMAKSHTCFIAWKTKGKKIMERKTVGRHKLSYLEAHQK